MPVATAATRRCRGAAPTLMPRRCAERLLQRCRRLPDDGYATRAVTPMLRAFYAPLFASAIDAAMLMLVAPLILILPRRQLMPLQR